MDVEEQSGVLLSLFAQRVVPIHDDQLLTELMSTWRTKWLQLKYSNGIFNLKAEELLVSFNEIFLEIPSTTLRGLRSVGVLMLMRKIF